MPAIGQNRPRQTVLPAPLDMPALAREAQRRGEPLVVMVSLPGCPWCEFLRRNYLRPMRTEGVAAYEFMVNDSATRLVDFSGERMGADALARLWKVRSTPSVLFFNAQGHEIAQRIEGVASADLIGSVLEERLAQARLSIKAIQ